MKAALLALLAGATLSAGAKPAEIEKRENITVTGNQGAGLTVAIAATGRAGKVIGSRRDVPISVVKPT